MIEETSADDGQGLVLRFRSFADNWAEQSAGRVQADAEKCVTCRSGSWLLAALYTVLPVRVPSDKYISRPHDRPYDVCESRTLIESHTQIRSTNQFFLCFLHVNSHPFLSLSTHKPRPPLLLESLQPLPSIFSPQQRIIQLPLQIQPFFQGHSRVSSGSDSFFSSCQSERGGSCYLAREEQGF